MMTQTTVEKKSRFQIDRLEDRIAPISLATTMLGAVAVGSTNAAVALNFSGTASSSHVDFAASNNP